MNYWLIFILHFPLFFFGIFLKILFLYFTFLENPLIVQRSPALAVLRT